MVLSFLAGTVRRPAPGTASSRVAPLADADELPPLDLARPPWPGREVRSGGITLHVRETPGFQDATPAVYLHGLSGSGTNWTDLAALLARHAPGMAVDLPGFGRSRPLESGQYTPLAHADAVLRFLTGQGFGRGRPVHLLGNSLGGVIALLVAARHPELVRDLTLLAPAMPDLRPDPRRMSDPRMALASVPLLGAPLRRELTRITPERRVEQMLRLCFGDPESVAQHRVEEAVAEVRERAGQPWASEALWLTAWGMIRAWLAGPSLWTMAARVRVPTLVVWGGRDRLVSPRLAARTTVTLPQGRLLALPEVGHVPQMERPVTVARGVLGMWRAIEAGGW